MPNVFVYGTLMFPEVAGPIAQIDSGGEPITIHGFKCFDAFHFFPYHWAMIWRWRWIKFKVVLALAAVRSVLRMSMIVVNSPWVRFVANTGSSSVSVTSVSPQKLHVVVGIGGSMLHAARLAIDLFRFDRT